MKRLNEDLKTGKLKNVYLLYGDESYLKRQYRNRLKKAFLPEEDSLNYNYFEGKKVDVNAVMELAETMPFFAEKRLIVVENSGLFKAAADELAAYLKRLPETTCMVFVESEVDKKRKLFKAVKDVGYAAEFGTQDENTLLNFAAATLKREGKQIRKSTALLLISKVGTDMENLQKELEKLISYTYGRTEITAEDVDAICTNQIANHIFDMIEAVANKQKRQALDLYYDLLALKEPPMRILFLLARQFRQIMEVKELMGLHYDKAAIAKATGMHPFVAGKCMQKSRQFTKEQLRAILEDAVESEEAVKTGRMQDKLCVEVFIVKYAA